ncbi:PQQ-dependent sugar dehydrogenase [Terrabacter tumescens]|uniref:PQQ-dependent sugar dehydrogenase n=1 Tax=Terrabacter tumescens TaxID=60443 RepID=UPI0004C1C4B5|nr:PQQ-dependent sugar dehydrogenase [Terrabacter tumescens]
MPERTGRVALAATVALALSAAACSSGAPSSGTSTSPASGPATTSTSTTPAQTPSTTPATTAPTPPASTTTRTATPSSPAPTSVAGRPTGNATVVRTLATGIDVPWGLARLPDGRVLVSARDSYRIDRLDVAAGRLTRVGTVPGVVSNVSQQGEAGLLGIAVSPTFTRDRLVYAYFSTASDNRIAAIPWDPSAPAGRQLGTPRVLVRGIPHNVHHNGGRLAFGPDGYLYATTGEAQRPALAQDKGSLGGKILRMTTSGRPAPGSPFGTLVWSYGHRNVQGIAWDAAGRLWASEFGDHSADELNLIRPGRNYGWPQTEGRTSRAGITGPVVQWGPPQDSPSGIAIAGGSVWMAALRGQRLWRIPLDGARTTAAPQDFLVGRYGRLRSVLAVDDRTILVTTSNRDGRQAPGAGDDRILLVRVT